MRTAQDLQPETSQNHPFEAQETQEASPTPANTEMAHHQGANFLYDDEPTAELGTRLKSTRQRYIGALAWSKSAHPIHSWEESDKTSLNYDEVQKKIDSKQQLEASMNRIREAGTIDDALNVLYDSEELNPRDTIRLLEEINSRFPVSDQTLEQTSELSGITKLFARRVEREVERGEGDLPEALHTLAGAVDLVSPNDRELLLSSMLTTVETLEDQQVETPRTDSEIARVVSAAHDAIETYQNNDDTQNEILLAELVENNIREATEVTADLEIDPATERERAVSVDTTALGAISLQRAMSAA